VLWSDKTASIMTVLTTIAGVLAYGVRSGLELHREAS
jgi:hypothetical protein